MNKNEVDEDNFVHLQFRNVNEFAAIFMTTVINNSLIIGVLLYEKKAKDIKVSEWEFKVKEKCFICDS